MRISAFLYQRISVPIAIALTLIMIAYASLVMGSQSECVSSQLESGQSILGLQFGYDIKYVHDLFEQLDPLVLKCYHRLLLVWDNLFPFLYGSMYIAWLSVIYKGIKGRRFFPVNMYPLVPVFIDWVENILEAGLIREYLSTGSVQETMIKNSSLVTQLKWSASFINYFLLLSGLLVLLYLRYRNKKRQK